MLEKAPWWISNEKRLWNTVPHHQACKWGPLHSWNSKNEFFHFKGLTLEWNLPISKLEKTRFQEADFLRADFWGTLMVSSCYMCHVGGHDALKTDGEGNGNPLQNSCLENPKNRGAWWAAVYGVAQSQTRLKRLSSSSRTYHIWKA